MLTYSCTLCNCFIRFYFWVCYAYIIGKLYISIYSSLIIFSIFIHAFFTSMELTVQLNCMYIHACMKIIIYCALHKQKKEFFMEKNIKKRDSYLKKTILPMLFNGNRTHNENLRIDERKKKKIFS